MNIYIYRYREKYRNIKFIFKRLIYFTHSFSGICQCYLHGGLYLPNIFGDCVHRLCNKNSKNSRSIQRIKIHWLLYVYYVRRMVGFYSNLSCYGFQDLSQNNINVDNNKVGISMKNSIHSKILYNQSTSLFNVLL